jgi:hypothetical protein
MSNKDKKQKTNDETKEKRVKSIGGKIDIAKKKLANVKKKKSPKQIRFEKMKAEMEALKKEINKEKKKTINSVIKAVESVSVDYKKVLKEISEITDDNFLLNTIIDFAIAQNEEIKQKFIKISELIKSTGEETNNDKEIYELMGYNDYDEMMKKKEEYELAELEEDEEFEETERDTNSEIEESQEKIEEKEENLEDDKKELSEEDFYGGTGY